MYPKLPSFQSFELAPSKSEHTVLCCSELAALNTRTLTAILSIILISKAERCKCGSQEVMLVIAYLCPLRVFQINIKHKQHAEKLLNTHPFNALSEISVLCTSQTE